MANGDIDVESALAFLQQTPSHGSGLSLYDHLTDVVQKILHDRPTDAVDLLETSHVLKSVRDRPPEEAETDIKAEEDTIDAERAAEALQTFHAPEPAINPDTGEVEAPTAPNEYMCEDLVHGGMLMSSVGVGLHASELYEVILMAKQLGQDPQHRVRRIRFFGKIFTLRDAYYVFETELHPSENEEASPAADASLYPSDQEIPHEVGSGVNRYIYFVCQHLGGQFHRLPDLYPAHIKAARKTQRFLTGSLQSEVLAFPPFPGNEAFFLRAQISRIATSTVLCPSGHFSLDEDSNLTKNEEVASTTSFEDLRSLSNWCHMYPHLKTQGRCSLHVRDPPENEEEADSFELTEEGPALLSSIDQDNVAILSQVWTVLTSSSNPSIPHQVIGVRSNLWPGAYSLMKDTSYVNIYVGWGFREGLFSPQCPPFISSEYDMDIDEVNGLPPKPQKLQENNEQEEEEKEEEENT